MKGAYAVGLAMLLGSACSDPPKPPVQPRRTGETAPASKTRAPTATRRPEVRVVDGDRAVEVAAGHDHFCTRLHSGKVACWGGNAQGQLGDGTVLRAEIPVLVAGLDDAEALFAGATCARSASQGVVCWSDLPGCDDCEPIAGTRLQRVPGVIAASRAVGLPDAPCFVTKDGGLRCLGEERGPLPEMSELRAVHQGHEFVCGETEGGEITCGGRHLPSPSTPIDTGLPEAKAVAAGAFHLCVVATDDRVHCWGDRLRSGYAVPQPGRPLGPVAIIDDLKVRHLAAGFGQSCAITLEGAVRCWGRISDKAPIDPKPRRWAIAIEGATGLAVGHRLAVGITESGAVFRWALNTGREQSPTPIRVPGLPFQHERGDAVALDSAEGLRAALSRADTPGDLGALASLDEGLVLGALKDGAWQSSSTACFAAELEGAELAAKAGSGWTCDEALERCVAPREGGGTVFRWVEAEGGSRALAAVIDYSGDVPAEEPPAVKRAIEGDPTGCKPRRALWRRDASLVGDRLVVLHHPAASLDDAPGPAITTLCGDEARRAARARLGLDPRAEDWRCDGLRCSYSQGEGVRGVFVFEPEGKGGDLRLTVVGEDIDPGVLTDAKPMLDAAIQRAKRHRCP